TGYKGESISRAAALSNFVGGGIGAGWASIFPRLNQSRRGAYAANDIFVPFLGTLVGGGLLPPLIENYGMEGLFGLYISPIPQNLMR
ncbi:MAG: hypothetical protein GY797_01385, partial [Deltaproteobacteria bacterium]|nr:hypothetical protein [Deltaproteobacteria bacterium]